METLIQPNIKIKRNSIFIIEFFKSYKSVGALMTSSGYLTKKIIKKIDFKNCTTIVEIGAGKGAFTFDIINNLNANAKFIIFEKNINFYTEISKKICDKRVIILNSTAENMAFDLKKLGVKQIDCVISSIPLSNFRLSLRAKILNVIYELLAPNGQFIQYKYSILLKKEITINYSNIKTEFTFLNFPPAFIFNCKK